MIERIEHDNLYFTPPTPTGKQVGEVMGGVLPDHKPGARIKYQVVLTEDDKAQLTYTFLPEADGTVVFRSVSMSRGEFPSVVFEATT